MSSRKGKRTPITIVKVKERRVCVKGGGGTRSENDQVLAAVGKWTNEQNDRLGDIIKGGFVISF